MRKKRTWEYPYFGLPKNTKGVYVIGSHNHDTGERKIVYIGSSKCIESRVLNTEHPYRKLTDTSEWPVTIFRKVRECDNYLELERYLIKRLQPELNIACK